jgi:two-component SAPR family response regulator
MNALKTLMHPRARISLDDLGYVGGKNIILQQDGAYKWNPAIPVEVDIEIFEEYTQTASSSTLSDERRLEACLNAVDVFKGDLSKNRHGIWAVPLNTYLSFTVSESGFTKPSNS